MIKKHILGLITIVMLSILFVGCSIKQTLGDTPQATEDTENITEVTAGKTPNSSSSNSVDSPNEESVTQRTLNKNKIKFEEQKNPESENNNPVESDIGGQIIEIVKESIEMEASEKKFNKIVLIYHTDYGENSIKEITQQDLGLNNNVEIVKILFNNTMSEENMYPEYYNDTFVIDISNVNYNFISTPNELRKVIGQEGTNGIYYYQAKTYYLDSHQTHSFKIKTESKESKLLDSK